MLEQYHLSIHVTLCEQEIDECWRTHSLSKKRKLDSSASEDKQIQKAINEVREGWAMKKVSFVAIVVVVICT